MKKRVLFHLPNPLSPVDTGSKRRIIGFLEYLNSQQEKITVDVVTSNIFGKPAWTAEEQDFLKPYCDHLFVYEGKRNPADFFYSRSKSFYYQKLLKQQLPIDSDYFTPPAYCRFVHHLLSENHYDIFWLNYLDYAHLATNFKGKVPHTVIDIHDLACEIRIARKNIKHLQGLAFDYEKNFRKETLLLNQFDTILVNSQTEMEMIRPHIPPDKLHLIPHLVQDSNHPETLAAYPSRHFDYDLLFVGTAYQPNIDGLNFFLDSIFPKILYHYPDTRLAIVGNVCNAVTFDAALDKNILRLGFVPDLSEIYLKTKVVICPLKDGSGTKVKLQEAMAYGMPIVSTRAGTSGLELIDGSNAFIADEPDHYAQKVISLLEQPEMAAKMSIQVLSTFERCYSNQAIIKKLDQLFSNYANSPETFLKN